MVTGSITALRANAVRQTVINYYIGVYSNQQLSFSLNFLYAIEISWFLLYVIFVKIPADFFLIDTSKPRHPQFSPLKT